MTAKKNLLKLPVLVATVVVAILAVILIYLYQNNIQTSAGKPVVKLGVILPLSGDLAFIGESIQHGAELANGEVKDTKYTYQLVFEDDELNPTKSVTALNKLVDFDKVSGVMSFSGTVGQALAPIAEKTKVPHFAISSDPKAAVGAYNYINFVSPESEAETMVKALTRKGIKTVATLSQSGNAGGESLVAAVEKGLKAKSIANTKQEFTAGDTDFRTVIQKLRNTNPDIYFIMAVSPEIELITKQLREAGIDTPITSIEGFSQSTQLELYEGQWFVDPADPTGDYLKKMKAKYNEDNPSPYGANIYDSIKLLVQATEAAGNGRKVPTNTEINSKLINITKVKYDGAAGLGVYFNNDGVLVDKAGIKEIRKGKIVYVGRE
ncbi:MAG: penicillin-binding protein activator [Candidatus Saccharibacteria bacterium]